MLRLTIFRKTTLPDLLEDGRLGVDEAIGVDATVFAADPRHDRIVGVFRQFDAIRDVGTNVFLIDENGVLFDQLQRRDRLGFITENLRRGRRQSRWR